jgi:hypothetical protein
VVPGENPKEVSPVDRTEIDALVDLVKFDYEHTLSFIDGVVRVSTNIRTIATAGWFGLIAAAVQSDEPWLAVLAAIGTLALGLQDAYHGWLYATARKRAYEMEELLEDYYKFIQRAEEQPSVGVQLLKKLRNHRLGQRSHIPDPARMSSRIAGDRTLPAAADPIPKRLWRNIRSTASVATGARPKFFYRYLYLPLVLVAIVVAIVLEATGSTTSPPPSDPPQDTSTQAAGAQQNRSPGTQTNPTKQPNVSPKQPK